MIRQTLRQGAASPGHSDTMGTSQAEQKSAQRPRVGVGVLVLRDGKLLLARRHNAHGAGTWSPSGGHLDFGETLEACAIREAAEETGVTVGRVRFLAITNDYFAEEALHYITIWMLGRLESGEPVVNAPDELTEVGWFALDDLPKPLFLPLAQLIAGASHPPDALQSPAFQVALAD